MVVFSLIVFDVQNMRVLQFDIAMSEFYKYHEKYQKISLQKKMFLALILLQYPCFRLKKTDTYIYPDNIAYIFFQILPLFHLLCL